MFHQVIVSGTQNAAEWVGALIRATSEAALHAAKRLRTATTPEGQRLDLWPSPGRGVRHTTFTPGHLTNLLLALGCGPPVDAAETVNRFRGLVAVHPYETRTETERLNALSGYGHQTTIRRRDFYKGQVLPNTFGSALDFIVEILAKSDADEESIRSIYRSIRVIVTIEPRPSAEIILRFADNESVHVPYELSPQQPDLWRASHQWSVSELNRVYHGAAFEALAMILNGTKAAGEEVLPSQPSLSTNENAAPGKAASRSTSRRSAPNQETAPQTSSLNTCDHTACVYVSSMGIDPKANPPTLWKPLYARTDYLPRPQAAGLHEQPWRPVAAEVNFPVFFSVWTMALINSLVARCAVTPLTSVDCRMTSAIKAGQSHLNCGSRICDHAKVLELLQLDERPRNQTFETSLAHLIHWPAAQGTF